MPYTFSFDHSCSDGARGYGAVCVETRDGGRHYIGRTTAVASIPVMFPDAGMTEEDVTALVCVLAVHPSFAVKVTRSDFRDLAADWHGGQWSPMYAYVSTGTILPGLLREVDECIIARTGTAHDTYPLDAENDIARLSAFRDYVKRQLAD